LKVLRHIAGLSVTQFEPPDCEDIETVTAWNELQGDVDCDNAVNATDALKLMRYVARLTVSQQPACPDIGS
jgi:hypothetical protein